MPNDLCASIFLKSPNDELGTAADCSSHSSSFWNHSVLGVLEEKKSGGQNQDQVKSKIASKEHNKTY